MSRLVSYDLSSDDADCSGNDEEEITSSGNGPAKFQNDDSVIVSLVNELVNSVSGDEGQISNIGYFMMDRKGYVDMRWRNPMAATKSKIRRKRRRSEAISNTGDRSSTDWSDYDSYTSDSSSSSSDNDHQCRTVGKVSSSAKRQSDYEHSEDSDYVYAKIVLESQQARNRKLGSGKLPAKTKGELDINDLPPIENLHITVPANANMRRVGLVSSIVDKLVIIQSDYGVPPLDEETWILDENRAPIGQIFEIFGPVPRPLYSIRFNSEEEAKRHLSIGSKVFFICNNDDFTRTVFTDALRNIRGSDASWEDNNEPPADVMEFSDDEAERNWKAQRRSAQNVPDEESRDAQMSIEQRPKAMPTRKFRGRGRGRGHMGPRPTFEQRESTYVARFPITRNPWATFQPPSPRTRFPVFRPRFDQPMVNQWIDPRQQHPMGPHFQVPLPPPFPVHQAISQRPAFMHRPPLPRPVVRQPVVFVDKRYVQNNN